MSDLDNDDVVSDEEEVVKKKRKHKKLDAKKKKKNKHKQKQGSDDEYEPEEEDDEAGEPASPTNESKTGGKKKTHKSSPKKRKKLMQEEVVDVAMNDAEAEEIKASEKRAGKMQQLLEQGRDPLTRAYCEMFDIDTKIQDVAHVTGLTVTEHPDDVESAARRLTQNDTPAPVAPAPVALKPPEPEKPDPFADVSEYGKARHQAWRQPSYFTNVVPWIEQGLIYVTAKRWTSSNNKSGYQTRVMVWDKQKGSGRMLRITGPPCLLRLPPPFPLGNYIATAPNAKNPAKTLKDASMYYQLSCDAYDPENAEPELKSAHGTSYDKEALAYYRFLREKLRPAVVKAILQPPEFVEAKMKTTLAELKAKFTQLLIDNHCINVLDANDDVLMQRAMKESRSGHAAKCSALSDQEKIKRSQDVRELNSVDREAAKKLLKFHEEHDYKEATEYIEMNRNLGFSYGPAAFQKWLADSKTVPAAIAASPFYRSLWEKHHFMYNPVNLRPAHDITDLIPLDEYDKWIVRGAVVYVTCTVTACYPVTKNSLSFLGIALQPEDIVYCGYEKAYADQFTGSSFETGASANGTPMPMLKALPPPCAESNACNNAALQKVLDAVAKEETSKNDDSGRQDA
jgi:hypothetical protein